MLPYTSRALHQERARRFLEEVNRDVRRGRMSDGRITGLERIRKRLGNVLIDLGTTLTRTRRSVLEVR